MKLEQGYTYPQFIKIIDSKVQIAKNNSEDYSCAWGIDRIVNFDLLCDKPLTKDMFVNEIEKPNEDNYPCSEEGIEEYNTDLRVWINREKKVIFKGWRQSFYNKYVVINDMTELDFSNYDYPKFLTRYIGVVKTIGDLFQATNGELELKNIEI